MILLRDSKLAAGVTFFSAALFGTAAGRVDPWRQEQGRIFMRYG